jgi:hypothetical protein
MSEPVKVPLTRTTWRRDYAGGVELKLLNRFFESDPSSTIDDTALIARPGTTFDRSVGAGPHRQNYSKPGLFNSDLFTASGTKIYRWDGVTETELVGSISSASTPVSYTHQQSPGVERLWIADSDNLYFYEGPRKAFGNLDSTGVNVVVGAVVRIDSVYYEFVVSGVDTGAPAGTLANPWKVLIAADAPLSLGNLSDAIGASGIAGGTYSTALIANPNVEVRRLDGLRLTVQAKVAGVAGNTIVTTETSASLSWGAGTLLNGGANLITPVPVPEGDGTQKAISVCTLAGYVIIAVANSQRMYLIRPGEFWVELFVSAESEPDRVLQVITVGSTFWALGESSIEPFTASGDPDFPMIPIQGRQMSYGIIPGTALVLEDRVIFVDDKGIVRDSSGARVSTHGIEEEIRQRT